MRAAYVALGYGLPGVDKAKGGRKPGVKPSWLESYAVPGRKNTDIVRFEFELFKASTNKVFKVLYAWQALHEGGHYTNLQQMALSREHYGDKAASPTAIPRRPSPVLILLPNLHLFVFSKGSWAFALQCQAFTGKPGRRNNQSKGCPVLMTRSSLKKYFQIAQVRSSRPGCVVTACM
jgi:hypothetical protein